MKRALLLLLILFSAITLYSQRSKGYFSAGTRHYGIAFGKPDFYNGIVFSGCNSNYSKGVNLRGFLFSISTVPKYVAGLNISFINKSMKEQALSINLYNDSQIAEGIQISLLNGVGKGTGIAISPFWSKGFYRGFMFSTFNNTDVVGCKLSALYAGKRATGLVVAPIVAGRTSGFRIAVFNIKYYHRGFLIGLLNVSDKYYDNGNTVGGTNGFEIGLFNVSYNGKGVQLGLWNATKITERKIIRQFGLININRIGNRTFQFGIINFVNMGQKCRQVGLINIIRSNHGIRLALPIYNVSKIPNK